MKAGQGTGWPGGATALVRTGRATVAAEQLALAVGEHPEHPVENDHKGEVHCSLQQPGAAERSNRPSRPRHPRAVAPGVAAPAHLQASLPLTWGSYAGQESASLPLDDRYQALLGNSSVSHCQAVRAVWRPWFDSPPCTIKRRGMFLLNFVQTVLENSTIPLYPVAGYY